MTYNLCLKGLTSWDGQPCKFQRAWGCGWHFLWCGDGVMGLTVIRPWNVSGPLASVGLARLWEDGHTKGTLSHSSGVTGQARWLLAIWQCSLVFAWEWIPGFLGAGKCSAPGRTLLLAQRQAQSCRSSLCRRLQGL